MIPELDIDALPAVELTVRKAKDAPKLKFAKHPSCFGKLDCRGIMEVALKHGMEVIQCSKWNLHCFNDVGLYGTAAQMKAVEAEWKRNGNELKPAGFTSVGGVNLDIPREQWVSVLVAEAKRHVVPAGGGTLKCRTRGGENVVAPPGYRLLKERELPRETDIAWDYGAAGFVPVDMESIRQYGPIFFKSHAHLILRLSTKRVIVRMQR